MTIAPRRLHPAVMIVEQCERLWQDDNRIANARALVVVARLIEQGLLPGTVDKSVPWASMTESDVRAAADWSQSNANQGVSFAELQRRCQEAERLGGRIDVCLDGNTCQGGDHGERCLITGTCQRTEEVIGSTFTYALTKAPP